jgi:hypothetical protein
MKLRTLIDLLVNRSPGENLRELRAKLSTSSADFVYDLETVTRSRYHMDVRRPIDRLYRYQHVLRRHCDWRDLDFEGRTVVEIGSGPLLGWGPIAAYLGCERYVCVDPRLQPAVVRSDVVARGYFLPMLRQLEALHGRGMRFADYLSRLSERVEPVARAFADAPLPAAPVDLVFSNNVLQHVHDLDRCLRRVAEISGTDTRQLHVVHFTDHESPPDRPFDTIYTVSPQAYLSGRRLVNLKRPSEVHAAFQSNGVEVELIPYVVGDLPEAERLHPYWRRFPVGELAVEIAFYAR